MDADTSGLVLKCGSLLVPFYNPDDIMYKYVILAGVLMMGRVDEFILP